ncbi:MAG TPA: SpoIID/LytB domain-containing protein [Epulopiscium sp.]|nr:SpoIID/LytB domain-containing protein [Candidatus Epulonipiscium sp.]
MQRRSSRNHNQNEKTGSSVWVIVLLVMIVGVAAISKDNWMPDSWEAMARPSEVGAVEEVEEGEKSQGISTAISRANAAKLIAYTFYSRDEINQLGRNIVLEDTLPSFWYDKYINAVVELGYMEGIDNKFYPGELLTYKQVVGILSSLSENKYSIKVKAKEDVTNQPISMQRFIEIYSKLINKLNTENPENPGKRLYEIQEKSLIVLATPGTDENLGPWKAATDQGEYGFEGLSMDAYIDQQIKVIVKNNEILGVVDVINNSPSLESAYITKVEKGQVEILIGGISKTYDTDLLDATYIDTLVDLHFKNGEIIGVDIKKEEYKDRVIRVGDSYIETEKNGMIPVSENLKIYDTTEEGVSWSKLSSIIVGTPDIEYAMDNGKINTITIKKKPSMKSIRLLLTTTDFEDKIHKEVKIKSTQPFVVDFYGEKKTYEVGEVMDINQWSKKMTKEKPRIKITSLSKAELSKGALSTAKASKNEHNQALLQVETIKRRDTEPLYPGTLEICKEDGGGYTLINEVTIEDYVATVIPSEMPTSYGIEACKVQAIVARSYAYVHVLNNKFGAYGANLDDSTNSQVYNNIPADEISLEAAYETKNQVLQYNGQVISSNCFSTSAGYTANYGEVWANSDGTFPANTPVYVVSKPQYNGKLVVSDMKDEKSAYEFFTTTSANIDSFDNRSPWFRWQVTMSADEISKSVNAGIKKRYSVNPALIKTLGKDRVFRATDIDDIGQVEKIQINKRGEGGNIMEIIFYGSQDTIKVLTEYNVRTLLSPMQRIEGQDPIIIKRQDATELKNYEMLPSAFFAMDAKYGKDEKLQSVTLYGGGFGHGVGMSQDGVRGMIERGQNYKEILLHYFPETKVGGLL